MATRMGLEPTISALTGRYVKPSTPPGRGWNSDLYFIRFLCLGQLALYLIFIWETSIWETALPSTAAPSTLR